MNNVPHNSTTIIV